MLPGVSYYINDRDHFETIGDVRNKKLDSLKMISILKVSENIFQAFEMEYTPVYFSSHNEAAQSSS